MYLQKPQGMSIKIDQVGGALDRLGNSRFVRTRQIIPHVDTAQVGTHVGRAPQVHE